MGDRKINTLESRAAQLADSTHEWNEIDFVGWKEFRRMAPAVVGLEIARLERVIADSDVGSDFYNALVHVRHRLRNFVEDIEQSEKHTIEPRIKHLEEALLALSMLQGADAGDHSETLRYAAHRLRYINDRIRLIY